MTSVLTASDVVNGVIDSVVDDGPIPPTARRLASRLHVAPATLYSVFPSLGTAYSSARELLVNELAGPLIDALARGDSTTLVDHLNQDRNRAVFVTDPSWPTTANPMLANALQRVGLTPHGVDDVLAIVGSLFATTSSDSSQVTPARVDRLIEAYKAASSAAPDRLERRAVSDDDVRHVLDLVDQKIATDEAPEPVLASRRASARLMFDTSEPEWSFRELGRITGIPVTRLHRYGSRLVHLSATNAHVLPAAVDWFREQDESPEATGSVVAFLLESGAAEVLIELYNEARTRPEQLQNPPLDEVLGGTIEPGVVALVAARQARDADRTETIVLADQFALALAA